MEAALETELKLEIDVEDRERLARAPLLNGAPKRRDHLVSTYFDTPNMAVRNAGFSLRVRHRDNVHLQTIKADAAPVAGLFVRPEWERTVPLGRPLIDDASGPLGHILAPSTLRWLERRFETDIVREHHQVSKRHGIVDLVIDQGEIIAGSVKTPLIEIELELRSGSPRLLFALARELNRDIPLRLSVMSKADRGYHLLETASPEAFKAQPVQLPSRMDTGTAFRMLAMGCLKQFRLNEDRIRRDGGPEAIHQARVALRRLRSLFVIFKLLLVDDPRTERMRRDVRWLASELGGVRAMDVLLTTLSDPVRQAVERKRANALASARTALASKRARELMLNLVEWLSIGNWREQPVQGDLFGRPVKAFARTTLDRRFRRLKRRGSGLASLSPADRHRVRIDAKRLRYAAEFFGALFKAPKAQRRLRQFEAALGTLQDCLGDLNDRSGAPDLLKELGVSTNASPDEQISDKSLLDAAEAALSKLRHLKPFWHHRSR